MADAILAAVVGLGLGALAAGVLTLMPPFSRHDAPAWETTALLLALGGLCVSVGAFAIDGWASATIIAWGAMVGGALFSLWDLPDAFNVDGSAGDPARLSPRELRRRKEAGDCWVLVTGAPRSGKTALIARMVAAASAYVQLAAPVRHGEGDGLRVMELLALGADGSARRLRFWEHTRETDLPVQPAADDLDGVVHVIDATRVRGTADSFAPAVRTGDAIDADAGTLALAAWLPKGRPVWLAITKADLLRLSIAPELVRRLNVGPDWHGQMRNLNPLERSDLAKTIGVAEHGGTFERGQGSPFLAYAGRGDDAFGGAGLVGAIVDTLAPEMKEHTIG